MRQMSDRTYRKGMWIITVLIVVVVLVTVGVMLSDWDQATIAGRIADRIING